MMRGLPSREWRTVSNYGATQQSVSTWTDKFIIWAGWVTEYALRGLRFLLKIWKQTWYWSISLSTRPRKIVAACSLLTLTFIAMVLALTSAYNWMVREDPCSVAERAKVRVLEDEERKGVFTELPKIIHWEILQGDDIPTGKLLEWNAEFRRLFPEPEYRHMLWTKNKLRELVSSRYSWYLDEFDDPSFSVSNSLTRFFILNEHGGLFADLDYEVVRNFWDALPKSRPALIESPYKYREEFQGILISSPRAHPFWNVTIELLEWKFKGGYGGPFNKVFYKVLNEAVKRAERTLGDNPVYELPCENFNRVPIGEYAKNLPFLARLYRSWISNTLMVKPCGNIEDGRCLFGMYHESALSSSTNS